MAKILIVDDEPSNLELTEALVKQEGFQTYLAQDGEQALKQVQEIRPDVILMDIVMPRMGGIEACRKIKTNPMSYAIPVIIVTALNTQEEKLKAIKAGADDFIGKPFDAVELAARLKSLARLKAIHDRLEANLVSLREMQTVRETLMERTVKDVDVPLKVILDCLQAVSGEQNALSSKVAQKVEPALFCVDMVTTMVADFANIMKMEQDKLRAAYESLKSQEQQQQQQQTPSA
jgi:CheY-like chemotaxis protein